MNGLSCHLPGRQGTRDPLKKQDCLQLRPAPNPCSPCRVPFLQCLKRWCLRDQCCLGAFLFVSRLTFSSISE